MEQEGHQQRAFAVDNERVVGLRHYRAREVGSNKHRRGEAHNLMGQWVVADAAEADAVDVGPGLALGSHTGPVLELPACHEDVEDHAGAVA